MGYLHQINHHQATRNLPIGYSQFLLITFISFAVFNINSKDWNESLPIIGSDSLVCYRRKKYDTCIPNDYLLLLIYEK